MYFVFVFFCEKVCKSKTQRKRRLNHDLTFIRKKGFNALLQWQCLAFVAWNVWNRFKIWRLQLHHCVKYNDNGWCVLHTLLQHNRAVKCLIDNLLQPPPPYSYLPLVRSGTLRTEVTFQDEKATLNTKFLSANLKIKDTI